MRLRAPALFLATVASAAVFLTTEVLAIRFPVFMAFVAVFASASLAADALTVRSCTAAVDAALRKDSMAFSADTLLLYDSADGEGTALAFQHPVELARFR